VPWGISRLQQKSASEFRVKEPTGIVYFISVVNGGVSARIKVGGSELKLNVRHTDLVRSIIGIIDRASIFLAWVVAATLIAMMLLTNADVFLRYIFRRSIMGTTEIVGHYFMVAVVFLPLAYAMIRKGGHIKVDFLASCLPPRVRVVLGLLSLFLSLCVYCLISWYGAVGGVHAWRTGETMVNINLPMWPGRALVTIGGFFLCIQLIAGICRYIGRLFDKPE